jgi:putative N6-adenine-specific DNA methylase
MFEKREFERLFRNLGAYLNIFKLEKGFTMYEYQNNNRFFAQVTGQLEELAEKELIELGARETKISYRGVYFVADHFSLYKINYMARLLSRVLAPIVITNAHTTEALTRYARKIKWEDFLTADNTFAITASVTKSKINNSLYASLCLKDGIADYFRGKYGRRPSVDTTNPDVRFNLHIEKDVAIISLDTSGESLHKRGYRLLAGEAPMQETLAAAIIRISGWNGEKPLMDCFCGSGTILCEALMHYCKMPAQMLRKNFGFTHMPDFEKETWLKLKEECNRHVRPLPEGLIIGSDKSADAIDVAKDNLSRLPYSNAIRLERKPFQDIKQFENGLLISNPPYGIRLGEKREVENLYGELGDFLKNKCTGTSAFIYTANPELRKSIGLRTTRRIPLENGKFEGVLLQIDSYEGSKKGKYLNDKRETKNEKREMKNEK